MTGNAGHKVRTAIVGMGIGRPNGRAIAANPRGSVVALCDLFEEVGPDAPTLCGDWTTRDLAAHLVMRERRPDDVILGEEDTPDANASPPGDAVRWIAWAIQTLCPDAEAREPGLADRRIDDAAGTELVDHALADLVRPLVLGDLLAHQVDGRVAAHGNLFDVLPRADVPALAGDHLGVLRLQGETAGLALGRRGVGVAAAVVGEDRIYFGSWDGAVHALDTAGELHWQYQTEGWVSASPVLYQGVLYVGSQDGAFYALDAYTGELIWRFVTNGRIEASAVDAHRDAIPPLRRRTEDIAELAEHFLGLLARKNQAGRPTISTEALAEMKRRPWHGNVRELRNAVQRAVILAGVRQHF